MLGEPYIKLRLSSVCQASDKHWKTKAIKGMQKSPFFNEEIKLYVLQHLVCNSYIILHVVTAIVLCARVLQLVSRKALSLTYAACVQFNVQD